MILSRLAAALAGLVLPVLVATTADAAPRHVTHGHGPAHVITAADRPASMQLVSRHRHHHRRHYSQRSHRRYG